MPAEAVMSLLRYLMATVALLGNPIVATPLLNQTSLLNSTVSASESTYTLSGCDDWIAYGDKCYNVLTTFDYFETADKLCQKHKARLASIHTELENDFVFGLIKKYTRDKEAWIGLSTKSPEVPMTWVDLTQTTFTKWVPSASPSDGRCAEMVAGGYWSGNICFYQLQSVCKRDKTKPEQRDDRLETAIIYIIPVVCVLVMCSFVAYLCVRSYNEPDQPQDKSKPQHLVDVATKVCAVASENRNSARRLSGKRKKSNTNGVQSTNTDLAPEELVTIAMSKNKPRSSHSHRGKPETYTQVVSAL